MGNTDQATTVKKTPPTVSSLERRIQLVAYGIGCEIWFALGLLFVLQWFVADKGNWQGLPEGLQAYVWYGVLYSTVVVDLLIHIKKFNRYILAPALCEFLFFFGVLMPFPSIQSNYIAYPCLMAVLSIHKCVIYGYGALQAWNPEGKVDSPFLTKARFTWFLFLFPISVALQVFLAYKTLPLVKGINDYYFYALIIGTSAYIPGFPVFMKNMLLERKLYLHRLYLERTKKSK